MVPFRQRLARGVTRGQAGIRRPWAFRTARLAALILILIAAFGLSPQCPGHAGDAATASSPAGASPAEVLDLWLTRQAAVTNWTADFVQTRTLKTLVQPLSTRGRVWFAPPGRFRWEVGDPPQTLAVRQSNAVLVLYPLLRRAERYPLDTASAGPWRHMLTLLEAGFPESRAQLESRFRLVSHEIGSESHTITLEPRSKPARRLMPLFRVVLGVPNLDLVATEMDFADGSRLRNQFSRTVINPVIDDSLFDPVLDPDITLTEPLGARRP